MQIIEELRRGYVNLFYLIERMRGLGVSGELQEYAMGFMRRHGVQVAQLCVSPTNARARVLPQAWLEGPRLATRSQQCELGGARRLKESEL